MFSEVEDTLEVTYVIDVFPEDWPIFGVLGVPKMAVGVPESKF